jgi:hypothetical protein
MTELIILSKVMLNRVTFYNKEFHFVRSALKLNLVMSCSNDARHQIPHNSAEPNGKAFKLTTLIDASTLLD